MVGSSCINTRMIEELYSTWMLKRELRIVYWVGWNDKAMY